MAKKKKGVFELVEEISAVVYILAVRVLICKENGEVLLLKRSKNDGYNPELWELPGGKCESSLSLKHDGIREVKEETGLDVMLDRQPVYYWDEPSSTPKYKGSHYVCLVLRGTLIYPGKDSVVLSGEHDDYMWINIKGNQRKLMDVELMPETRMALELFLRTYL